MFNWWEETVATATETLLAEKILHPERKRTRRPRRRRRTTKTEKEKKVNEKMGKNSD
jgi:hypothetical protein